VTLALVLGANGFVGRHVVEAMSGASGIDVIGAGIGAPLPALEGAWRDIDLLAGDDDRLEADLRSSRPSLIVNCTGATTGSAADLVRLNVLVTARVLESIARSGVQARLVHLGSAAEYGPGPAGLPVAETACARPVSAYGIAKLAATQLVATAAAGGLDAVVLRVFNALGPGMPAGSMPGSALERLSDAVRNATPRIEMGPLGAVRDFVDVRDIGAAVVAACLAPRLDAPILNVGSGTGHTARELVEALAVRVGFDGEIGEAAAGSPRSSDEPWQIANVELVAKMLGWRAVHDLRSTVERMTAQ